MMIVGICHDEFVLNEVGFHWVIPLCELPSKKARFLSGPHPRSSSTVLADPRNERFQGKHSQDARPDSSQGKWEGTSDSGGLEP